MSGDPSGGKAAVLGAGSWGTALAIACAHSFDEVVLWGRDEENIARIAREGENRKYLPGGRLAANCRAIVDHAEALSGAAMTVVAVPSDAVREVVSATAAEFAPDTVVVSATKGLEPDQGLRITEVIAQILGPGWLDRTVVLSGPNLAVELTRGIPTAAVAASADEAAATFVQVAYASAAFRVYTGSDVTGVEMGGALKNIIALGAGISDGLGFGDNTKGALITRGLAEMVRLGTALGAHEETFYGLTGVGDLFATCASRLSRNRTLGFALGQGSTLAEAKRSVVQTAEGVPTTKAARELAARLAIEMPITEQVYWVLFEAKSPKEAVRDLMTRAPKAESSVP
jgi:glycerol-3-phosphate dehydrogenase (NAD(P)+)